jgi:hypothetical protein
MVTTILKAPGQIMPDQLQTNLTYIDVTTSSIGTGGTVYGSVRYRPTAVYDVNPIIGGTTIPGFTELAAFYSFYRVIASSIQARLVNQDSTTAVLCVLVPLNQDPTISPSAATIQSWQMNPYAQQHLISSKGGMDQCTLKHEIATQKMAGTRGIYFDDSYASQVTTTPANNWFWALGVLSEGGVNFTNGVTFQVKMNITVQFYDRKELIT